MFVLMFFVYVIVLLKFGWNNCMFNIKYVVVMVVNCCILLFFLKCKIKYVDFSLK